MQCPFYHGHLSGKDTKLVVGCFGLNTRLYKEIQTYLSVSMIIKHFEDYLIHFLKDPDNDLIYP